MKILLVFFLCFHIQSGKILLRFKQERRSAVGSYGGNYEDLLNRNLWTIGKDLANVFQHFDTH